MQGTERTALLHNNFPIGRVWMDRGRALGWVSNGDYSHSLAPVYRGIAT